MQISKEDKLSIIKAMMKNNNTLSPLLFDDNKVMLPHIRKKILDMVALIQKQHLSFFPYIEVEDVFLSGSLCSYIYTPKSDIDLFILFKNISDNNILKYYFFSKLSNYLNHIIKPKIYNHSVDFGITYHERYNNINDYNLSGHNTYSVLNNCWHKEPIRQNFDFTAEELYIEYSKFSAKIHQLVKDLPKINNAYLTYDSAVELSEKLLQLKMDAFIAKDQDEKHEYSMIYNIYRISKKFCLPQHFMQYAEESYRYNLSQRKQ